MRKKPLLRLPALLIAVCLLAVLLPPQRAAAEDNPFASNPNISYRVDGDTLVLSGTGWVYEKDLPPESVLNRIKHVTVEPGITRLTAKFMENSKSLETVTLPEGLDAIVWSSFEGCENLRSINIPSTVASIGEDAFRDCTSLTSIQLPAGLTRIYDGAFYNCASLSGVVLPAGLEELGGGAFYNCTSLTGIELPQGLKRLGGNAFNGCTNLRLTSYALPQGLEYLSGNPFRGLSGATRITIPGGVVNFTGFGNSPTLEEVVLSPGVRTIAGSAFSRDSALKRVDIPNTVTSIGYHAFEYCTSLEEITLPASLTSLHQEAFLNCDNLQRIIFQGTEEQWDAFDPLIITKSKSGAPWDPDIYFTGDLEFLGMGVVNTVTVTFDAGAGTVSPARKEVIYGEKYGELPTPANGNRIFYGWYTQPEGGTLINSGAVVNNLENHTLYAHWSADTSVLTPARPGETMIPARHPFETSGATYTFLVTGGSNAGREREAYLYANEKGGLTRVQLDSEYIGESNKGDQLVITEMDSNFNVTAQGTVPTELTYFMGFYPGKNYNFLLFAQFNPQGDNHEIVRVVKYDKNWNRLGAGYENVGMTIGIGNGTGADFLECAEYNDYLYVHFGRVMEIGHQACQTMVFRQSDMERTDSTASRHFDDDYVSHAYDQQILVDRENRLVSLDLTDGKYRGIRLFQYKGEAHGTLSSINTYQLMEVAGTYEEYELTTGCTVAGMVEAGDFYLVVYQYDPTLSSVRGDNGDLFYQFVHKELLTGQSLKLADAKVDGVKVVAADDSSGYIIWTDAEDSTKIYYAAYGNGTMGAVRQAEGYRAGSTPIVYQGKLVWYVDIIERQPNKARSGQYYKRFYTLDPDTGAVTYKDLMMTDTEAKPEPVPAPSGFTDVPADSWYEEAVVWAAKEGYVSGTNAEGTLFSPLRDCTEAEILALLHHAAGSPVSTAQLPTGASDGQWYSAALRWAMEKGMIDSTFRLDTLCTRAATAHFLWQIYGSQSAAGGVSFPDVSPGAWYADAVAWAVGEGIVQGDNGLYNPDGIFNRASIALLLYRTLVPAARLK